jgi:RimJ/RimL family protein N-acetyltransferase/catechol 2,3-dioxygenase-like lactoylglutathione lyase family enzyme
MSQILGIEHTQLEIPPGGEPTARRFYTGVLGLSEIAKPASLRQTGAWFVIGSDELHLGVARDARPAIDAHTALQVTGLADIAARCQKAGHPVEYDHRYPGRTRFYVRDPFGNRLELFEVDGAARNAAWHGQPTLHTDRLVLRPFRLTDAPAVKELAGAAEVADTTMNIPHPYPEGAAETWIARHPGVWDNGTQATFAVVERESAALSGAIGLVISEAQWRAELGYWIAVGCWGRGYATEAGRAILDFAFTVPKVHRVQARHFVRNPASGRVMQKLGMRFEGVLRDSVRKGDRFEDVAMYAILSTDRPSAPATERG